LQADLRDSPSLASNDKALRFLNGMRPEQMYIDTLLHRLETKLLDSGRRDEGEMVGLLAGRLSRAVDLDRALQGLYTVGGWDAVAIRLMWYTEQMRQAAAGTSVNEELLGHRLCELAAMLPVPDAGDSSATPRLGAAARVDLRDALFRFGSSLEGLRRASFTDGRFSGLPELVLQRVVDEAALLGVIASEQQSRDIARFAQAFSFFATHVLEHGILHDVKVLHIIGAANLTLQTVLETAQAEDFDSLYQTIALLESPRTLLQSQ
jgi:hypothetical protein